MSALKPSLGQLDRLPGEARNRIYDLAADSSNEEVDIAKRCHPYGAIALVSKQVHRESVGFIRTHYDSECQHRRFVFKIPRDWESKTTIASYGCGFFHTPVEATHHLIAHGFIYRFLTAHLGKDVPLAIIITFREPPKWSEVAFYGASARRTSLGQNLLQEDLSNITMQLTYFRRKLDPSDVDFMIRCIFDALDLRATTFKSEAGWVMTGGEGANDGA